MAKNNIRRLKAEADIRSVVDYCGIQRGRRIGTANFVVCPNPEHMDEHPTNAYYRDGWNTIYCTTCGINMGPIDILMWSLNISYGEAADILWELEGRPDWYYAKKDRNSNESTFWINHAEADLLGIKLPGTIYKPVRYTQFREFLSKDLPKGCMYHKSSCDGYLLVRGALVDWTDFIPRDMMRELVLTSGKRRMEEYSYIEAAFHMQGLFSEERKKVTELMDRARRYA